MPALSCSENCNKRSSGTSKSEIDSYIQGHPDQFAKRQVFDIEQVSFPPQKDMDALAAATKDFKSLDQVQAKLNDLGIKFSRGTAAMDSATLPPEMLKALVARKPDDIFFIRSNTNATFFKVTGVQDKPLTGDPAENFARRQIQNELARKTARETYDAALASAKYEGDYERIMKTGAPAAPAAATEQSGAQPAGQPATEAPAAGQPAGEAPAAEKPAEGTRTSRSKPLGDCVRRAPEPPSRLADAGQLLAREPIDDAPAPEGGAHFDKMVWVDDSAADDRSLRPERVSLHRRKRACPRRAAPR